MGNCNYNKKFRQSVNKINGVAEKKIRFTSSDNFIIIPKFDVSNEYFKVINKVQKMVCYSDLYTWLAFNKKCNTYINETNFEILKSINSFDEWEHIFDQSMELYCETMKQVLNFCNSSAFHKILRIKCLSEDDIDQIEKISTIFYHDLEEYTVNVDVDYINDKIVKIMNSKNHTKDHILN